MPSPFPGMNPYLEGSLWREVHTYLITAIASDLNARLPGQYRATVEQSTDIAMMSAGFGQQLLPLCKKSEPPPFGSDS